MEHILIDKQADPKITGKIIIDNEVILEVQMDNEDSPLIWVSRSTKNIENHSKALSVCIKIACEIALHKIKMDNDRVVNFKGAIGIG